MRVIATLSGGKSSAWCANWAAKEYGKENTILYFNDTKWEHPDLYRFLRDISRYIGIPITEDTDGRTPEEVFRDLRFLGNNRVPICSRVLKANRLQKFYKDGDILVFGIGPEERHRADRIVAAYQKVAVISGKYPLIRFPLIENNITKYEIVSWLTAIGIEEPYLYRIGFPHNNCSGGCVRAGSKQWYSLLNRLPEVYTERERAEENIGRYLGKKVSYMKEETLHEFRDRVGQSMYDFSDQEEFEGECIGICDLQN